MEGYEKKDITHSLHFLETKFPLTFDLKIVDISYYYPVAFIKLPKASYWSLDFPTVGPE